MNRVTHAVALLSFATLSLGRTWAADADDDGALLADASSINMPTYSLHALNAMRDASIATIELAGLTIDAQDRVDGIGIVRRGERTLAALETLLAELGLSARRSGTGAHIDTPLGTAQVDLGECVRAAGGHFCDVETLAAQLALDIVFDRAEYVVRVRAPWPRDAVNLGVSGSMAADVSAPKLSVSYARSQLGYRRDRQNDDLYGTGEFGGGMGNGYWRSAWFQDSSGRRGLYDYAWITQRENARYLIGHQVMGLDPLLPSFDLLGAQGVWTNAPRTLFDDALDTRRLVSDRVQPNRSLRGDGPPGGRADLRVDGELVDSVVIPLTGRYVFDRQQRTIDPLAIVQVHLYERAFDTVPARIEDRTFQTGDRLLPQGAYVHFAGAGVQGNPLGDSRLRDRLDGTGSGFWQARYGASAAVTLEAAVQRSEEGDYAIAGAHIGLGGYGSLSALVGRNDEGAGAIRIQADGQRRRWFWRGFVQEEDAGYRIGTASGDRVLRYGESGWMGNRWMLSVVGREERDANSGRHVSFVRPALSAQPLDTLSLSIRPDSEGDYGYLVRWAPAPRVYFNAFRDRQRDQFEAHWALPRDTRLVAGWVRDESAGERRSLLGYREHGGARNWRYGAGVLESEGRVGWLVETGAELGAGTYLSAQATDDPLGRRNGIGGATMWLNLSVDLVNTGRGFTRSTYRSDYSRLGSIAGRVSAPAARSDEALAGIPVRVDSEVRAYTDDKGNFHVGGLAPGVHRVELDDENLPVDYAPTRRRLGVEVRAGRSTPVRFGLEQRLGLAGRAVDVAGNARAGVHVRLLAIDGRELGTQATDTYGYFRFSELAPGRYRVELQSGASRREFELVDRFLFEQDLVLSDEP